MSKKKHSKKKNAKRNYNNKPVKKESKLMQFWIDWKVLIVIGIFALAMIIWNLVVWIGNM